MDYQEANPLKQDIDTANTLNRPVYYKPANCEMIEIVSVNGYDLTLATGISINLLDKNVRRDSFYFNKDARANSNTPYQQELEDRKQAVDNAPTWLEAKEQQILLVAYPNLMPTDAMFNDGGQLYPTKLYPPSRIKSQCTYNPVKYDIEYVVDFYQHRVIKQLSLENQLTLLDAITKLYDLGTDTLDSYSIEDISEIERVKDLVDRLLDTDKLQLCKDLAKSLGMRVIKK